MQKFGVGDKVRIKRTVEACCGGCDEFGNKDNPLMCGWCTGEVGEVVAIFDDQFELPVAVKFDRKIDLNLVYCDCSFEATEVERVYDVNEIEG